MTEKLCRKCLRWLPLDAFPLDNNRNGKQYRASPCVECRRFKQSIWRSSMTGRQRKRKRRERYAADPDFRAAEIGRSLNYYYSNQDERARYMKRRKLARTLVHGE